MIVEAKSRAARRALFVVLAAAAFSANAADSSVIRDSRGGVRFVIAPAGTSPESTNKSVAPEASALRAVEAQRKATGASALSESWRAAKSHRHADRDVVDVDQLAHGVPVFGARARVQVRAGGTVASIAMGLADDLQELPAPNPKLTAKDALATLRARHPGCEVIESPALTVFSPSLLSLQGAPRYAWQIALQTNARADSARRVFLDAETGAEFFSLPLACTALERKIFDAENDSVISFTPTRAEGAAAVGQADVDAAYDYAGQFYDFLQTNFARDGVNGEGAALKLVVRYCTDTAFCPYPNAFWSINAAFFGQGFALADDVVGHELAHGITEDESGLIYFGQPGAINEAVSDIMGELFDVANGAGTDTPELAGLIGEDVPTIGAFRSLSDPTLFDDPDSTCSEFWYTGDADGGGIHTNCGVINKLAALLLYGGKFNGETVVPLSATNALNILYRVQTDYLVPTSSFEDFYNGMLLAAADLGLGDVVAAKINAAARAVKITPETSCQTMPAPPLNDTCANAKSVTPGKLVEATNSGATGSFETSCGPEELNDYRDVWFRFVADSDLTVIALGGALTFAPVLGVGVDDCESPSGIACDISELGTPIIPPLVQVSTTPGTAYLIRVAGRDAATGDFTVLVNVKTEHDADQNGDHVVTLAELLRIIQFYNSFSLHCAEGTEDGYAPGAGDTTCTPHDSDYAPQDWSISLAELLRVIQFYNSGGYAPCESGEDGFCPGPQ